MYNTNKQINFNYTTREPTPSNVNTKYEIEVVVE